MEDDEIDLHLGVDCRVLIPEWASTKLIYFLDVFKYCDAHCNCSLLPLFLDFRPNLPSEDAVLEKLRFLFEG